MTEKLASVGRSAATVADELNNPLEAVTNFIYHARTTDDLPEPARRSTLLWLTGSSNESAILPNRVSGSTETRLPDGSGHSRVTG